MNKEELLAEFDIICDEVRAEENKYSEGVENVYEKLLLFIRNHADDWEFLSDQIVSTVKMFRFAREEKSIKLSVDAIAFCMHSLRWPSVLQAAKEERDEYFSGRYDATMNRLISSFDDDWDEAMDYRFYRDRQGS